MNMVPAGATSCPTCGFNGSQQNPGISLPIGYRLNNRYVSGRLLESDGDSARYTGYDVQLSRKVEIREFLPVNGCSRNTGTGQLIPKTGAELHFKTSLMDFSDLYINLNKLSYEEGLVRTYDYFEANQTAYAILEFFDAMTLREHLGLKGGIISFEQCSSIMEPVFGALNSIHSVNLTHRGVSPETILISRTGVVKLSGFATTSVRTKGTDFACKLFSGYSAPEQYSKTMWQSTATDVYGLSATIYRCLTGTVPQDADQRKMYDNLRPPIELNTTIPAYVSKAVMLAMLIDQQARTQTILGFKQMLSRTEERYERTAATAAGPAIPAATAASPSRREAAPEERGLNAGERVLKTVAIVAAAFFVLMLFVYFAMRILNSNMPERNSNNDPSFPDHLTIPNYVGLMLSELDGKFDVYNFSIEIEAVYSEGEPEGKIISTSPSPNSTAKKGDVVTLYVNMTKIISMVDFEGLTVQNAELLLKELGVGKENYKIEREESTKGFDSTVIEQSVEPGDDFNVHKDLLILKVAIAPEDGDGG